MTVNNKRTLKRSLLAALVFALGSPWALADPGNGRSNARETNRPSGFQRQQQANQARDVQQRDFRRNDGEMQRPQRLSPEERRQLRRDIKDAGREIYLPRR